MVSLIFESHLLVDRLRVESTAILWREGDAKENSWIVLIHRVPAACVQARRGGSRPRLNPSSSLFTAAGKVEKDRRRKDEKERG